MSNLAGEPPRKTNQPPSSIISSPPSFSSLPFDIVLNVIARVPKRYYPILCCVCKSLRSLVRSPEIQKTRSFLGKDSIYLCFMNRTKHPDTFDWFTLRRTENSTTENVFASIDFPCPYSASTVAVGPEIFVFPGSDSTSPYFWIFDTQSGKVRQGPRLIVKRRTTSVGLVGGKIYVIGGCRSDKIPAEAFDLKTQTWEAAPIPDAIGRFIWICGANVSLDRKVCAISVHGGMVCYDTRDGSCERSELPNDTWWKSGVCVIDNVLYVYFSRFGLMWYDTELLLWRVVYGLDLGKTQYVGMAQYYGMLAFIWEKPSLVSGESKEIWFRMIGLLRSDVGIHETPSQLLGVVPCGYRLQHCLSLSGQNTRDMLILDCK
ncbi:F-box/kelch-repeat protein At2g44700 isoform X2 [Capsella rubella]|uniref:F-box/kelch-repeat protein At2g44700 isoform X2 n=1 Tax=Capsella rubella TaxID=81985 RepID=UPI000CD58908|nr:F-box/kelch-repeat protein At2g44700 isoform X2 [Capsella rubella]